MNDADAIAKLHATLSGRETPETVAGLIGQYLPVGSYGSLARKIRMRVIQSMENRFGWSSMPTTFQAPADADRQIDKARELALLFLDAHLPQGDDPDAIARLVAELNALIGRQPGSGDFRHDRMDRSQRALHGLTLSRRRYDRLFRLIGRLETKLAKIEAEQAKYRLLMVSKAGLAHELTVEQLGDSLPTAAFVAYYAARTKLRSEFTIFGQQRPFDDLAELLLDLCEADDSTNWHAIAQVFPRQDVLARLTDQQKSALLGRWFAILNELADLLEAVWQRSDIDLPSMIVRRGNDSSTWNMFAGAWNTARDHWIALIAALGMDDLLDQMMPGKVMRLMAADVAQWHRSAGGGLHPDTKVWVALPKPWDVLRMEVPCNRVMIEQACAHAGVDAEKSGWSAPRPRTAIARFRPTPELVHGVAVANPQLAVFLKQIGAFSGRPLRQKPAEGPQQA